MAPRKKPGRPRAKRTGAQTRASAKTRRKK